MPLTEYGKQLARDKLLASGGEMCEVEFDHVRIMVVDTSGDAATVMFAMYRGGEMVFSNERVLKLCDELILPARGEVKAVNY